MILSVGHEYSMYVQWSILPTNRWEDPPIAGGSASRVPRHCTVRQQWPPSRPGPLLAQKAICTASRRALFARKGRVPIGCDKLDADYANAAAVAVADADATAAAAAAMKPQPWRSRHRGRYLQILT